MTVEQAINTAIAFEARVAEVYEQALGRFDDPSAQRVLGALALEERGHLAFLRERLEAWRATGQLSFEGLRSQIPSPRAIAETTARLRREMNQRRTEYAEEAEALRRAVEVESETNDFYRRMAEQLEGPARAMFARFLEIEQGHLALVKAELDSVNGLGFWFDVPEFSLEKG